MTKFEFWKILLLFQKFMYVVLVLTMLNVFRCWWDLSQHMKHKDDLDDTNDNKNCRKTVNRKRKFGQLICLFTGIFRKHNKQAGELDGKCDLGCGSGIDICWKKVMHRIQNRFGFSVHKNKEKAGGAGSFSQLLNQESVPRSIKRVDK
jgi:hypothetical protein